MPLDPTETTTSYRATAPRWYLAALALGATPEDARDGEDRAWFTVSMGDRTLIAWNKRAMPHLSQSQLSQFQTLRIVRGSRVPEQPDAGVTAHDATDPAAWMRALSWLVTGDDRVLADPRPPHLTHAGE